MASEFLFKLAPNIAYIGNCFNKISNGYGTFLERGKFFHTGQFKNGFIEGFGKLYSEQGQQYEGELLAGNFHGIGRLCIKNKFWFGQFQHGNFVGGIYQIANSDQIIIYKGLFASKKLKAGVIYYNGNQLNYKLQSDQFKQSGEMPQKFKLEVDSFIIICEQHDSQLQMQQFIEAILQNQPKIIQKESDAPQIQLKIIKLYPTSDIYIGETTNLTPNGLGRFYLKQKNIIIEGEFNNGVLVRGRRQTSDGVEQNEYKYLQNGAIQNNNGKLITTKYEQRKLYFQIDHNNMIQMQFQNYLLESKLNKNLMLEGLCVIKHKNKLLNCAFEQNQIQLQSQLYYKNLVYQYVYCQNHIVTGSEQCNNISQCNTKLLLQQVKLIKQKYQIIYFVDENKYLLADQHGCQLVIDVANQILLKMNQGIVFKYNLQDVVNNQKFTCKIIDQLLNTTKLQNTVDKPVVFGIDSNLQHVLLSKTPTK